MKLLKSTCIILVTLYTFVISDIGLLQLYTPPHHFSPTRDIVLSVSKYIRTLLSFLVFFCVIAIVLSNRFITPFVLPFLICTKAGRCKRRVKIKNKIKTQVVYRPCCVPRIMYALTDARRMETTGNDTHAHIEGQMALQARGVGGYIAVRDVQAHPSEAVVVLIRA